MTANDDFPAKDNAQLSRELYAVPRDEYDQINARPDDWIHPDLRLQHVMTQQAIAKAQKPSEVDPVTKDLDVGNQLALANRPRLGHPKSAREQQQRENAAAQKAASLGYGAVVTTEFGNVRMYHLTSNGYTCFSSPLIQDFEYRLMEIEAENERRRLLAGYIEKQQRERAEEMRIARERYEIMQNAPEIIGELKQQIKELQAARG